ELERRPLQLRGKVAHDNGRLERDDHGALRQHDFRLGRSRLLPSGLLARGRSGLTKIGPALLESGAAEIAVIGSATLEVGTATRSRPLRRAFLRGTFIGRFGRRLRG